MRKFFALAMFFIMGVAFSPPEKVVKVNVSDDISYVSPSEDVNITTDCNLVAEFNFELINEAEVEISYGLTSEVSTKNATREQSENLIIGRLENSKDTEIAALHRYVYAMANEVKTTELTDNFTLNHKLYETNTGYMVV